jgi:nucleoside-diphosphate-sugar epimerase
MILVTGCAGFIGSALVERLLKDGHEVTGIDNFSDYYPRSIKERNMAGFMHDKGFGFVEGDITKTDLDSLLKGKSCVFHQAAQAGIRESWGRDFEVYLRSNVLTTQRLLEACKGIGLKKFVYASSSSVYGDAEDMPTKETAVPRPISPYGVTKLAGENLCYLYWRDFGLPCVSLRYFNVYGPGQRPDMAFNRFIRAMLSGNEVTVYGDGRQTRDFTYVDDIVSANLSAMESDVTGEAINVGGGSRISVNETLGILEGVLGVKAKVVHEDKQKGDARHTSADISKAGKLLGYSPKVGIRKGLSRQVTWMKD